MTNVRLFERDRLPPYYRTDGATHQHHLHDALTEIGRELNLPRRLMVGNELRAAEPIPRGSFVALGPDGRAYRAGHAPGADG